MDSALYFTLNASVKQKETITLAELKTGRQAPTLQVRATQARPLGARRTGRIKEQTGLMVINDITHRTD